MQHILPIDIELTYSNIAETDGADGATLVAFVVTEHYYKGVKRFYNSRLWESYTEIYELATYSWNDLDTENLTTTKLSDNTIVSNTVDILTNDVVYVYSEETYYKSKKDRTAVDFEIEVHDVNNWDLLVSPNNKYRYEWNYPSKDSIYWKDLGATNRNKCVDQAINTQSEKAETINLKFLAENIDLIALLNIECKTAQITITDTVTAVELKNETINVLSQTFSNRREWMRYKPIYKKAVRFDFSFFTRNPLEINIILTGISASSIVKLGEILAGAKEENGLTLDGVPVDANSGRKIIENEDTGEVILEDENIIKTFFIYNFELKIDTTSFDTKLDICSRILSQRILVFAENTDEIHFESMVVYGFVRKASPTLKSNWTKSEIALQVQSFVLKK